MVRLPITQIQGRDGGFLPVSLSEKIEETTDYPDVVAFLKPVTLEGSVTNVAEVFVLEAKVETELSLLCSRCLASVSVSVGFSLHEKFAHAGNIKEETEAFSGDQLDLTEVVRRGILGALPMKALCVSDCKGLCPKCGCDLNTGACGCDTTELDPRLESLRALFKVDEEV